MVFEAITKAKASRFLSTLLVMLFCLTPCLQAQHCAFKDNRLKLDLPQVNLIKRIIPTVVHVLYSQDVENISDSLIFIGLKNLNEIYALRNADSINRNETFKKYFIPRIRFAIEPITDSALIGIVRLQTITNSFNIGPSLFSEDHPKYTSLGGADAWDTDDYLNIWVCNLDPTPQNPNTLLGYAFPPTLANDWDYNSFVIPERQGVVTYKFWNDVDTSVHIKKEFGKELKAVFMSNTGPK